MNMLRILVALGISILASFTAGPALALPFTPVLDEFWVVKNSTEIFRDSFNDGVLPPSGPDDGLFNPTTYSVFGSGGMTSEVSGKLTLTPSLGDPTVITSTFADVATDGTRLLATNPANPNYLGQDSAFQIHGLYDMANLPMITGQSFGIRATDRAVNLGNAGNNTYALFVGVNVNTGDVSVFLRSLDFVNNSSTVIDSVSIQSLLAAANQIELILSKGEGLAVLDASYILYDINDAILASGSLGANAQLTIYDGEGYIRPQFSTTDRIPVPEPATLALLGLGLGLAGAFLARGRRAPA